MENYFDEKVAGTYDQLHVNQKPAELAATVDCLAWLAGRGSVLEFAIGTGRVTLPLVEKGLTVKGIELSQAMIDALRKKERGETIDVFLGDMTQVRVPGDFSLVFLVFNTIDNLTSQDAQIACFENAARHLSPGGRFLIETLVPPIQRLPFGQTDLIFDSTPAHLGFDTFDIVSQNYSSTHLWMKDGEHEQQSIPFRYAWPAELDLMARLAGLELEHRWADWDRSPFDRFSKKHISVWRKPLD